MNGNNASRLGNRATRATIEVMTRLYVEQRRGFAVEAVHPIDAVACDAAGSVRVLSGDDALTTFRSASKPFQLEVTLAQLDADVRARLSDVDLALGAASHHGEPAHLTALAALQDVLGCRVSDLYCGAHLPTHTPSAHALLARGERPTALHNNCAGKHTFMAAATHARGWAHDYRPADHPLQAAITARLAEHTGHGIVGTVIDGCGVPCFVLRLSAMARAYAALAVAQADPSSTLGLIGRAMRAHPAIVSGSEAFDGWLMQHSVSTAPLIAKVGALGLLCVALPAQGLGLAIKVRSGSADARPVATEALLARYVPGVLDAPLPAGDVLVHNVAGTEVGALVTRFEED